MHQTIQNLISIQTQYLLLVLFLGFVVFTLLQTQCLFMHLFFYQIKIFDLKNPSSCLNAFKSNNFFGLIIFLNILIVKIL